MAVEEIADFSIVVHLYVTPVRDNVKGVKKKFRAEITYKIKVSKTPNK